MRSPIVLKYARTLAAVTTAIVVGFHASAQAAPRDQPIAPLPTSIAVDPARAALGRQLFGDTRLSVNDKVLCRSCHDVTKNGADSGVHSTGFGGGLTAVNTPTVFNAAFNFRQFWDGRATSLEAQIETVVQNPIEMGSKWKDVVARIAADPKYQRDFDTAYPDGVTQANIENALASYERTLITPDSRFDRYLRGDAHAMTALELTGYEKFKQYGCIACHQGRNIGGNMFQKFGVMGDYFAERGHGTKADLGRYLVTGMEDDRHVFKVPSLRNVALTAPYFHDGSAATLDVAVDVMFRYQLGRIASEEDHAAIVAFLKTLTGKVGARP